MQNLKKSLSIILAVLMLVSLLPVYSFAAETLKAANVTQWPTLSYKNEQTVVYYGQTQEMALVINDDEIVIDSNGNQVAGHFEFRDTNNIPSVGTRKANIKFIPDDTDAYSTFTKMFCADVTYEVVKVTPVLVDENDSIPVATEVEAGATLSTSTLSGARYVNPYNAEEPDILERSWEWVNPNTVVNESGYYQAMLLTSYYDPIYEWVLVRIKGDTSEVKMGATIEELPTVEGTYTVGDSWADVKLVGGKAVGMNGEELTGTFAFDTTSTTIKAAGAVGTYVIFTPDDSRYSTAKSTKLVEFTVNKGTIRFIDENGNDYVPTYTIPYGTTLNNWSSSINSTFSAYLNCGSSQGKVSTASYDYHKQILPVGTHNLKIMASPWYTTSNYVATELDFILIVEPSSINMQLSLSSVEGETRTWAIITKNYTDPTPQGTFDVYLNDVLTYEGLKANSRFSFTPEKSGTYDVKVVYNPIDNDPLTIEDIATSFNVSLKRVVKTVNCTGSTYIETREGATVEILGNVIAEDFGGWKFTDADGNEVDIEYTELGGQKISFTVPDYDLTVEAINTNETEDNDSILSFFKRIINMFCSFFKMLFGYFIPTMESL